MGKGVEDGQIGPFDFWMTMPDMVSAPEALK